MLTSQHKERAQYHACAAYVAGMPSAYETKYTSDGKLSITRSFSYLVVYLLFRFGLRFILTAFCFKDTQTVAPKHLNNVSAPVTGTRYCDRYQRFEADTISHT